MAQAFDCSLPSSQKLVLLALCNFANDDGLSCHPSVAQIAKKSSLSDRQCKRVIKELIDGKWVSVVGNERGGAPGSTRHYRINVQKLSTGDTHDTREQSLRGDTHDTGDNLSRVTQTTPVSEHSGVTNRAETGDTGDTQSVIDPSIKNNPPNPPGGKCADFDVFWCAYPRKSNKKRARQIWQKLKPDAQLLETMLAAIRRQSKTEQWTREGGKFIPHPTTWLNGARWEDEVDPTPPSESNRPRAIFPE